MNKQAAYATFRGVVGKITRQKEHMHVMLFVNAMNRHGHQVGRKIYNIYLFDTAFTSTTPYLQEGDHIHFDNVEIDVSDEGKVFFRVKHSTDVLIIAKENRNTLLGRLNNF